MLETSSERATWPVGGGETAALIRAFPWSRTALGPIEDWPQSLRTAVDLVVACRFPMILLWGPGLVQVYNDAYRDLMGAKHPSGLGQPTRACWPEVWHINEPIYRRVFGGESVSFEDALYPIERHGFLEDAYFSLCYSPVRDEAGAVAGVLITVSETTGRLRAEAEHREAEDALRRSEQRLAGIVETAAEGIVTIDPEGRFLSANAAAERILGVSRAELIGSSSAAPPFRRLTLDGAPLGDHPTPAEVGAAGDRVFHNEYAIERADGSRVAIARNVAALRGEDGAFLGVVSTFSDITERLRAEAALRASEAHFRLLGETLPLIVSLARPDGTIEYINPHWQRFSGRSMEDFVNGDWLDTVHLDDQPTILATWPEALAHERPYEYEFRARAADGTYRWLQARGLPVREADGRVTAWVNTAIDIHDRKEAEARQGFLLEISDALRPLADPAEIKGEVCRLLAERLEVDRAYCVEVDEAADLARVDRDFVRGGAPSLAGEHRIADFGWSVAILRRGECHVVADTQTSSLISEADRPAAAALGIIACMGAPLIKEGRLVGALCVTDPRTREWSGSEVALLREVGERIWAAVERARAEAALRESARDLRQALDTANLGTWTWNLATGLGTFDVRGAETVGLAEAYPPGEPFDVMAAQQAAVHPDDRSALEAAIAAGLEAGETFTLRYRAAAPGGGYRHIVSNVRVDVDETGRPVRLTGTNRDVTTEVEAEAALAAAAARDAFLVGLADAFRSLTDPIEIQAEAMRVLGLHLGVLRAQYYEVEPDDEHLVTTGGYASDGPPLTGRYRMDDFGAYIKKSFRAGRKLVVADGLTDVRVSEAERAAYVALGFRAFVGVPLVKDGRFVVGIGLHHATPRDWTDEEVTLVEEVAERTWAAVARARAEAALREGEARFRGLAESVPLMVWSSTDATVDYFNQRWFDYTGMDPESGLGEAWHTAVHPEDVAEATRRSAESGRTGAIYEMEYRLRRADGEYRWHIARAVRIPETGRWIGTATDIHDLKQAGAAVRRSEERARALLTNLPGGAAFIVDHDLRYALAGGEALEAAGLQTGDFVGKTIFEALDPELAASYEPMYRRALTGDPFFVEHDAHGRSYLSRGVPLRDEGGAVYAALAVSYDITDRRLAEAALERAHRELEARVVERTLDLAKANARLRAAATPAPPAPPRRHRAPPRGEGAHGAAAPAGHRPGGRTPADGARGP